MTSKNVNNKGLYDRLDKLYACRVRGWIALVSLLLLLLFGLVFFNVMSLMHRAANDPNVTNLQLSFTASRFKAILLQWSQTFDSGIEVFKLSVIILDYIFPIIYASFLAFSYAWIRGNIEPSRLDRALFIAPFVAGLFDCIENSIHLLILRNVHNRADIEAAMFSDSFVFAASMFAALKYLLVIACFLAIIVAVICRFKNNFENEKKIDY